VIEQLLLWTALGAAILLAYRLMHRPDGACGSSCGKQQEPRPVRIGKRPSLPRQ
jgi:hypothetical protein